MLNDECKKDYPTIVFKCKNTVDDDWPARTLKLCLYTISCTNKDISNIQSNELIKIKSVYLST